MLIKSARMIYFSPTGTTRRVLEGISQGLDMEKIEHIDLTLSDSRKPEHANLSGVISLIGVPVYGGRVPVIAINALKRLKAGNIPAVIIAVYGNRAYEDALIELRDLSLKRGFFPIAGGAFIGEHSLSNKETPIASGRPDKKDIEQAVSFGMRVKNKITEIHSLDEIPHLTVPGNFPYREIKKAKKYSPVTVEELCIKCGRCTQVCPTEAVRMNESVTTDQEKCIRCCSCIKNCPTGARIMEDPRGKDIANWLYNNCQERKEPETFLI
ncbi:MAG: EFR1 family ferrodoxin [Deltaproteobacteria bacterium]|nr:EFR1 family ferrodoxin [Deltaproteobacteria bacterium]